METNDPTLRETQEADLETYRRSLAAKAQPLAEATNRQVGMLMRTHEPKSDRNPQTLSEGILNGTIRPVPFAGDDIFWKHSPNPNVLPSAGGNGSTDIDKIRW